jgi:hypothetical protein
LATVNVPERAPPDTEQDGEATTVPDIVHDESLIEYPDPETCTVSPTEPELGLRVRDGNVKVVLVLKLDVDVVVVRLVTVEVVVVLDVA